MRKGKKFLALVSTLALALLSTPYLNEKAAYADAYGIEVDTYSSNWLTLGNYNDTVSDTYYETRIPFSPKIQTVKLYFSTIDVALGDYVRVYQTKSGGTPVLKHTFAGTNTTGATSFLNLADGAITVTIDVNNDGKVGKGFRINKIDYTGTSYTTTEASALSIPGSTHTDLLPKSAVANLKVYEDSSVTTYGYSSLSASARSAWDAVPSPAQIGFTTTTTTNDAHMRLYVSDTGLDSFGTSFPTRVNGVTAYWNVYLDNPRMTKWGFTTTNKQKTTTHEYGHVLGLDHYGDVLDVNTVMKTGQLTRTTPSPLDTAIVQTLWKP